MINNNPYNLPDIPPPKPNRIYTDSNVPPFRQDLYENGQSIQSPRSPQRTISRNNSFKAEQFTYQKQFTNPSIRPYIPSPKATNPSYFTSRVLLHDKPEQVASNPLRESSGINPGTLQTINDRIENLTTHIKMNEKRIIELQKNSSISFLPNNSKITNQETNIHFQTHSLLKKAQTQIQDVLNKVQNTLNKLQQEMAKFKQQMRQNQTKIDQINYQNKQIIKETLQNSGKSISTSHSPRNYQEDIKKQITNIKNQLQQKLKRNFQFLTSVIGRVQRQTQNYLQPNYKVSPIKCSHTAILLRFVQSFKVRKHSSKTNQTKITLTDNTYYIDNQGYLLDKQQFYLIDSKNNKIKLQDKHVKLLKDQGILL